MYWQKQTCKDCKHTFIGYFCSVDMSCTYLDVCSDCGGTLDSEPHDPHQEPIIETGKKGFKR